MNGHATIDRPANTPDRADERGDVAEPDAPTATEDNEGLSTVLSGEPGEGVQDNESER